MILNIMTVKQFFFFVKPLLLIPLLLETLFFRLFSPNALSTNTPSNNKTTFEWLVHGSFKFTTHDGRLILLDPCISTYPSLPEKYRNFEGFDRIDLSLFSQGHVDHFMVSDLKVLAPDESIQD